MKLPGNWFQEMSQGIYVTKVWPSLSGDCWFSQITEVKNMNRPHQSYLWSDFTLQAHSQGRQIKSGPLYDCPGLLLCLEHHHDLGHGNKQEITLQELWVSYEY